MRKYYTRPCNFHYGNYAKDLVKNKKALPLAGNSHIVFDQIEIFKRKKGRAPGSCWIPFDQLDFIIMSS